MRDALVSSGYESKSSSFLLITNFKNPLMGGCVNVKQHVLKCPPVGGCVNISYSDGAEQKNMLLLSSSIPQKTTLIIDQNMVSRVQLLIGHCHGGLIKICLKLSRIQGFHRCAYRIPSQDESVFCNNILKYNVKLFIFLYETLVIGIRQWFTLLQRENG